jgi:membrane protease YdiL (CAAX protease family)
MVLPQLWAGLVFGFIRMRISLPAAMMAHALGNLAAVTVAFLLS